jgi:hypothetical protein
VKKPRKHSTFSPALLIAALVFSLVVPMYAEAYVCPVHKQVVDYARELWADEPWMSEIEAYLGDIEGGACTYDHAEDYLDHVWDYYGTDGECITITHFWEPDNGLGDIMHTTQCNGQNAAWKAMILWGMALGEYHSGDKHQAYEYLGHVAHLLTDMSVPAHAHDDSHVFYGGDTFDDKYMNQPGNCNIENAGPPECLYTNEKERLRYEGILNPEGPDKLLWLFYTTAQLAGMYASDEVDGNTSANSIPSISVDFSVFDPGDECDDEGVVECDDWDDSDSQCNPCLRVIRNNSYLRSIRAVAALYKLFEEQSKQHAELTLVTDRIEELECHDDLPSGCESEPEFFVRVKIGDFWFRNEGNHMDDTAIVTKHWGFARNVGLTGVADVWIELWDDDDGNDDPSDICAKPGERALWMTVDLEKCRSGAPDAVQGDLTGACGVQLTSAGDDDDRSQIWFRILPPNSPPVAHAGPDQTVYEGDLVTLNGSFDDPDVDDTHTFLWHMESSSNGQSIPNSTDQSLSFVPFDNGVYTFSFSVTDNHGAQDSDTVVVTVLNVPPVVSAPYISNQPNSEFILPVVHRINFEGTFTDAGTADTHTAFWNWGDSTTSNGNVTETNGSGSGTNSHTYSLPGDYTVTLTVTDDDGGSGSNTMTIHIADVGEALNIFNAYIQSLPASVFKNNADNRKNAFDNKFDALNNKLATQNYKGMIQSMNSNIRTEFDGLVGGNPKDDWIIQDLAVQTELCQKVDDITSYLRYLSNMH